MVLYAMSVCILTTSCRRFLNRDSWCYVVSAELDDFYIKMDDEWKRLIDIHPTISRWMSDNVPPSEHTIPGEEEDGDEIGVGDNSGSALVSSNSSKYSLTDCSYRLLYHPLHVEASRVARSVDTCSKSR